MQVLAICSIEALEPLEYGLKYNSNGAFLVEVTESGRRLSEAASYQAAQLGRMGHQRNWCTSGIAAVSRL